jgi:glucose/arabinose dehydrogenase
VYRPRASIPGISATYLALFGLAAIIGGALCSPAIAQSGQVLTGAAALGDWRGDAPGVRRHIGPADLTPHPQTVKNKLVVVPRSQDSSLKAPPGFTVEEFVSGLSAPRMVPVAPNGDIFVVDVGGQILVSRTTPRRTTCSPKA